MASELLKPCDARLMLCYPVSSRINSVAKGRRGMFAASGTHRSSESSLRLVGLWGYLASSCSPPSAVGAIPALRIRP